MVFLRRKKANRIMIFSVLETMNAVQTFAMMACATQMVTQQHKTFAYGLIISSRFSCHNKKFHIVLTKTNSLTIRAYIDRINLGRVLSANSI